MRLASDGAGRNDHVHGDEDEIEATRRANWQARQEWLADNYEDEDEPKD